MRLHSHSLFFQGRLHEFLSGTVDFGWQTEKIYLGFISKQRPVTLPGEAQPQFLVPWREGNVNTNVSMMNEDFQAGGLLSHYL